MSWDQLIGARGQGCSSERGYCLEVANGELVVTRDYDLPCAIVWDALVDPILLDGWLARAEVEPHRGGAVRFEWYQPPHRAPFVGEVTEFTEPVRVRYSDHDRGSISIELAELDGGTRGTATRLVLTATGLLPTVGASIESDLAHWQSSLDQLEDLLRGHPVDWSSWQRDRSQAWNAYFDQAIRHHAANP